MKHFLAGQRERQWENHWLVTFSQKESASLLLIAHDQHDPVTPANCKEYEEHEEVDGICSESSLLALNMTLMATKNSVSTVF